MFIKFKSLEIENYHSIGNLKLDILPGKHLIVGENRSSEFSESNGGGKSSLMESIPFTCFKKDGKADDPSRDGKGDCKTSIVFDIGDCEYRVERYFGYGDIGNSIKLYRDGTDISSRTSSATEKELHSLLGMSYDLFVSTVVVLQGFPVNFTTMTPTIRKQIVEELLGASVWEEYRIKFRKALIDSQQKSSGCSSQYSNSKDLMVSKNSEYKASLAASDSEATTIISQLDSKATQLLELTKIVTEVENEMKKYSNVEDINILSKLKESKYKLSSSLSSLSTTLENRVCNQCGQDYPVNKIDSAREEITKIEKRLPILDKEISDIVKIIDEYNIKLSSWNENKNSLSIVSYDIKSLKSMLRDNKDKLNKIEEIKRELEELTESCNGYYIELQDLNKREKHIKYLDGLMLPSSKFRTLFLKKYLELINSSINEVSPFIFNDIKAKLYVPSTNKGIEIKLEREGKPLDHKRLSGGEKRRVDIIFILAFQRFLLQSASVTTNLVVLDEVFEGLDKVGIQCVVNALDSLFDDSTCTYVITHNSELKQSFDSIIKMVNIDGVSSLVGSYEQ